MSGIFVEDFFRASIAIDFAFDAEQAAHGDYVAGGLAVLLRQVVHDELSGEAADGDVVAVHVGGVVGLEDVALQADHGDLRLHSLSHDGGQRGALIGGDDQKVGLLAYEGLHLRDLFAVVLLRVADHEFDVGLRGEEFGHQRVLRGAIGLGVVGLAEGHDELLLLHFAAATGQKDGGGQSDSHAKSTLHSVSIPAALNRHG